MPETSGSNPRTARVRHCQPHFLAPWSFRSAGTTPSSGTASLTVLLFLQTAPDFPSGEKRQSWAEDRCNFAMSHAVTSSPKHSKPSIVLTIAHATEGHYVYLLVRGDHEYRSAFFLFYLPYNNIAYVNRHPTRSGVHAATLASKVRAVTKSGHIAQVDNMGSYCYGEGLLGNASTRSSIRSLDCRCLT